MAKSEIDSSRLTSNRSYSIPVAILAIGWILMFIGVCVVQGRFNQLTGTQGHTPFSLFWFFIFFWLVSVGVFIFSIVSNEMARAKSLVKKSDLKSDKKLMI